MGKQWFHRIAKLRGWRQRAFLLALVSRSLPNLILYARLHELEKPARQLAAVIDGLWEPLLTDRVERPRCSLQEWPQQPVARLLEDWHEWLADDESFGADAARNCIELVEALARTTYTGQNAEVRALAESEYQLVLTSVELQEGEGLEDEALAELFDEHELCREAGRWHREILRVIGELDRPDTKVMSALRESAENGGVSNLGISPDAEETA